MSDSMRDEFLENEFDFSKAIKNIEDWCKIKPYVEEICHFDKNKCMQVGSSYNINKELKDILDLMRLEPKIISVDTTFT